MADMGNGMGNRIRHSVVNNHLVGGIMNEHAENIRKIQTAIIEAAAPELRYALQGGETDEERFREELEYQLRARNVIDKYE